MAFQDVNQILRRFEKAWEERELKLNKFAQAYRLAFPTHAKWLIHGEGSLALDKTIFRWDTTAIQSLKTFASNIQSLLMPPFDRWATFRASAKFNSSESHLINQAIQEPSDILFNALDASNLLLEANVAFQDMGIAVGLLQIHATGNEREPLRFESIPMHTVALGSFQGKIVDVYRKMKVEARSIPALWPDASIDEQIRHDLNNNPDTEIDLLEGTIYYPTNDDNEKYQYFVLNLETREFLVNRRQRMSRWIPFRFAVSPGEVWGDGPVLQILDSIRIANKIVEMDVLNAGLKISRPLFVKNSTVLNPNNLKMEPGAIIYVNDTNPNSLPIVPFDYAGDFNFDQLTLERYQSEIREALFADPLGPNVTPNQSATEVSIRQQNWLKKSAASLGRLTNELLRPIIQKSCVLLQEQGFMSDEFKVDSSNFNMSVNGQEIEVDFLSPLAQIHDKKDAQDLVEYSQMLQGIVGPQMALGGMNVPDIFQYLSKKMNVDPDLVKDSDTIAAEVNQAQQMMGQQQLNAEQAQQNQPSPGQVQPDILPQLNIGQA